MAKRWVGVVVGALTWSLGAGLNAQAPPYPSYPTAANYPAPMNPAPAAGTYLTGANPGYPAPPSGTYPSGANPGYQPLGMDFSGGMPSGYPATPQAPTPALPEPYPFPPAESTVPNQTKPSVPSMPPMPQGPVPFDPAPLEIHPDDNHGGGTSGPKQKNPPYPNCSGWYLGVGATVLERQKLGHLPLILQDPQNLDTGTPPPITAPILQDAEDLHMPWAWGPQVTVGYHLPLGEIEATGFALPKRSSVSDVMMAGRLDQFFFNPPLGFEGDNGLWLQADRVRTEFDSTLYNGEVNAHLWSDEFGHLELIGGVRYVDLLEDLNIFTDDDGLTVRDINNRPDPTRQAYYLVKTHNRLALGQLGFGFNVDPFHWLSVGGVAKGAWGADFLHSDMLLVRGDGLVGREGNRRPTTFSHMYETGLFFDFHPVDSIHLRAGYNTMWLLNIAEAIDQVNMDLSQPGRNRNAGSVFYSGPTFQLEFFF